MANIPSNKTIIKAILVFGSAQVIAMIAALVRSKVAAVTVGTEGVGLTSLYLSITSFIATAVCLGLSTSGVQTLSKAYGDGDDEKVKSTIALLRLWEVLSAAMGVVVMIIIAPLLCQVYFGHWHNHLHSVMLLSLVPAATVVSGIEGAILRSLQQMKRLTYSMIAASVITVVVSVPLYYIMRWDGIPFIITITAVLSSIVTFCLGHITTRQKPEWHLAKDYRKLWEKSRPMIGLGFAFIISGLCSTSQELIIQSYMNTIATLSIVGLYKMGYQFALTYPGMIFTAIENDFYPRLTALGDNVTERNMLICRQIRVLLSIVIPCILVFIALLPWIIPFLLSDEFTPLIPMVRFGALAIIVRAVYLPIAYMPIALGRSKDFIHLEIVSSVMLVICAIGGCKIAGLTGIGASFIVSQTFDLIYVFLFCRRNYSLRLGSKK